MPIAQDIKNIAEDIEVSYGQRVAFLSDLFKETNDTLKTFGRQRRKMSSDLWGFLSTDREAREKIVQVLRGKNQKELSEMAEKLTHFLKENRKAMKEETATLMMQIRDYLASMEKEMANLLSEFQTERHQKAADTRKELVATTRRRIEKVKKLLTSFATEHREQSRKLQEELAAFRKGLKSAVKEMRLATISDLKEASDNWQNLAQIMAAKRVGKKVTPGKKIDKVPQKEVAEAVKAFTRGEIKEETLRVISESPLGITLPEVGKALKVAYVRLARPVSELLKEGKVRKEDTQYFGT